MALNTELMAGGMHAELAKRIGFDAPVGGLTATGSTQGGALVLTSTCSIFGTVAAGTGAIIASNSKPSIIYNGGANALTVYPVGAGNFLGVAASTGISVPTGKSVMFIPVGNQIAVNVSA